MYVGIVTSNEAGVLDSAVGIKGRGREDIPTKKEQLFVCLPSPSANVLYHHLSKGSHGVHLAAKSLLWFWESGMQCRETSIVGHVEKSLRGRPIRARIRDPKNVHVVA
jgi:hypothetical protein